MSSPGRHALVVGVVLAGCANSPRLIGHTMEDIWPAPEIFPEPSCQREKPTRGRHACWIWGHATDRSVSPGCRVDRHGAVSCWRAYLAGAPAGEFVQVDDNGYDACALRADRTAVCWGSSGWTRLPTTPFARIAVGRSSSPLRWGKGYACGLTEQGAIACWESGADGRHFGLDGGYTTMEAGDDTVCGLLASGDVECLPSAHHLTQDPPPPGPGAGPFIGMTLGTNRTGCVIRADRSARCWTLKGLPGGKVPERIDGVTSLRAGSNGVCGIDTDGRLRCWGRVRTPPAGRFATLSRPDGNGTFCGRAIDGATYCWGDPTDEPAL